MLISAIFSEKKNQSSKELVSSDLYRSHAFSSVFHKNLFSLSLFSFLFSLGARNNRVLAISAIYKIIL